MVDGGPCSTWRVRWPRCISQSNRFHIERASLARAREPRAFGLGLSALPGRGCWLRKGRGRLLGEVGNQGPSIPLLRSSESQAAARRRAPPCHGRQVARSPASVGASPTLRTGEPVGPASSSRLRQRVRGRPPTTSDDPRASELLPALHHAIHSTGGPCQSSMSSEKNECSSGAADLCARSQMRASAKDRNIRRLGG